MSDNTERRHQATALKYNPETDQAPIITAMGQGIIAQKIVEKAKESDIPIVQNESLSEVLQSLSVGDAIPPRLYEAVAQILVFISRKDNEYYQNMRF